MRRWIAAVILACTTPAVAQQPTPLFDGDPLDRLGEARYGWRDEPQKIVSLPVIVNVGAVGREGSQVLVQLPLAPSILARTRFDPFEGPWPFPPDLPDSELSYSWYGSNARTYMALTVLSGSAYTEIFSEAGVHRVESTIHGARLEWVDLALDSIDDIYPPFPPPAVNDQVLELALEGGERMLQPGDTGVLLVTVNNAGPDRSAGAVVAFDQALLAGRLELTSRLSAPGREHGPCGQLAFPALGTQAMQVLRIYIPELAAGESITCPVPLSMLKRNNVHVRAMLHIRNPTLLFEDPRLDNNAAELTITGAGVPAALPAVAVPGPDRYWLLFALVLFVFVAFRARGH